MQSGYEFYNVASRLKEGKNVDKEDNQGFELAQTKAHIVMDMKKRLQTVIFALAAYITFKVELKEIPSYLVWKVAMRMANTCKSQETGLWNQTVQQIFQEYPMLKEYGDWFYIDSLHPVGWTSPESYSLLKFWILFDIYKRNRGEDTIIHYVGRDSGKIAGGIVDNFAEEPDCNFWSTALNISKEKFMNLLNEVSLKLDKMG